MSRRRIALGLLAASVALLASGPAGASHDGPLAGQWHLDAKSSGGLGEETPDSSEHDGQDASAATVTLAAGGRWDSHLSSSNAVVLNAGNSDQLAPAEVTLVAWIRHNGATGTLRYVAARGGGTFPGCEGSSYALYTGIGDQTPLSFYIRTVAGGVVFSPKPTAAAVFDGAWHMVAGVFDGSAVRLYVDGAEVGTGTSAPGAQIKYDLGSTIFTIDGYADPACGNADFPGGIDEVRVYDRALSATELGRLAAASPTPPELVEDDVTAPETTITAGPAQGASLAGEKAVFSFGSSEPGSTFQCRVFNPDTQDPPTFTPCSSPYSAPDPTRSDVPELKVFEVRAKDAAGNVDPTPETRMFSTDNRLASGNVPKKLTCDEVRIVSAQGRLVHNGCRIAPVEHGKVRCVHGLKMTVRNCRFTRRSGAFVRDATGTMWALVGQSISRSGKKGGPYLTASPIEDRNRVPCGDVPDSVLRAVHGKDTAGQYSGVDLGGACVAEKYLVGTNYGARPLQNVATKPVCSTYPHPEIENYQVTIATVAPPAGAPPGTRCWVGKGAGLNDPAGRERDKDGWYLTGGVACHQTVVGSGIYATGVIVAKRPATTAGSTPQVRYDTPIVWRPVSPARIAN
jgi:hypothetical protein